jgi:hypothetical protein
VRRLWRLLRIALWILAALGLLLTLAYVFRSSLLAPWLRGYAERELASLLGAKVQLGELSGNWYRTLSIQGVEIRRGQGPVEELEQGHIQAEFDLWRLLEGESSGLLRLEIRAERLVMAPLRPLPGPSAESNASGSGSLDETIQLLFAACPQGLELEVADFAIRTQVGERRGPLRLAIPPSDGSASPSPGRELVLRGLGIDAQVKLDSIHNGRAQLGIEEPELWAALFGLRSPVRSAQLVATLDFSVPSLDAIPRGKLQGALRLRELEHENRRYPEAHVQLSIHDRIAQLDHLRVEGPGLSLRSERLTLPLEGFATSRLLQRGAGSFELHVHDLRPWQRYLPRELCEFMPIEASVKASTQDGQLRLEAARVAMRGAQLELRKGQFPLVSELSLQERPMSLEGRILLDSAHALAVPGLGPIQGSGEIHAQLSGSIQSPRAELRATLRQLTWKQQELRELDGMAEVELGPDARLLADASLQGRLGHVDWTELGIEDPLARELSGMDLPVFDLQVESILQEGRLAELTVNGSLRELSLPELPRADVHLRDLSIATDSVRFGELELHSAGTTPQEDLLLSARGRVAFAEDADNQVELRAHAIPLGSVLAIPALRGLLERELVEASLLERELPLADLRGAFDFAAQLSGSRRAPSLRLDLAGHAQGLLRPGSELWPLQGFAAAPNGELRLRLGLDASPEGTELRELALFAPGNTELELRGSGPLPLRLQGLGLAEAPQGERPLRIQLRCRAGLEAQLASRLERLGVTRSDGFELELVAAQDAIRMKSVTLEMDAARASAELALQTHLGALLWGETSIASTALDGVIQIHELRFDKIPTELHGLDALSGAVQGSILLRGSLSAPEPSLELSLSDAAIKADGLPRINKLAGRVRADARGVEELDLGGMLGGQPFALRGSLASPAAVFWQKPGSVQCDVRLEGLDLLLARQDGAKLRGDVDLRLSGGLEHPHVTGNVALRDSKYVKQISLLPDLRSSSGAALEAEFVPFRIPGELGTRLSFDVGIETREALRVRTGVLNTDLSATLRLRGQADRPFLVGTITSDAGALYLPGVSLNLQTAIINFPETRPYVAELRIAGTGRRYGYRMDLNVSGTQINPEITFTSVPALPPESVLVLATTGQLPKTLEDDSQRSLMVAGGFLANQLLRNLFGSDSTEAGSSWIDRISFSSGEEVSDNGVESLRVEYDIDGFWFLRAERDVYEEYNADIGFRIRLD